MSSIWRRLPFGTKSLGSGNNNNSSLAGAGGGGWHRNHNTACENSSSVSFIPDPHTHAPGDSSRPTNHLITKADEELFLSGNEVKRNDPLQVQSQFVKTVLDILHSPSTLPYFVQFLQGWGVDKYARFWLEANSFHTAAVTRSASESPTPSTDVTVDTPSDVADRIKGEESCPKPVKNHSRDVPKDLVLPDLVSNIQYASDVTPLSSPEGVTPDALTCHMPRQDLRTDVKGDCVGSVDDDGGSSVSKSETFSAQTEDKTLSGDPCDSPEHSRLTTQRLRKSIADDALTIFKKYLTKNADFPLCLDEDMVEDISCRISAIEENVDPGCFLLAQEVVIETLEKEYLPKFLSSDYYLKHQIDVLTSGSVRLADIIYSDSAFPYFMEYVEQEGGQSVLQFWVAVSNFRQQLLEADQATHDPNQAQADAMILYDKYFSLQATSPQGFSDTVRFLIEGNICKESGPLPTCFDLPLRVVLHILERDFLPGYLSSSLHISYLSELINTVKSSVELFGRKKRTGSESTCSSEQSSSSVSISTHNTLLAMDSSATPSYRLKSLADPSSMRIDAAQLYDPDSLWRRKNFTKLSCGFINELGRFEAEIETHPNQRQASSGLQKIRRLMGREEDKVKEDMAYQVAEMIIKDVTRVTLGSKGKGLLPPPPPPS